MKQRIVTVVGTRPQFIKAATVSRIFKRCINIEEILVHTGQHYDKDMSDVFFDELEIQKPSYFLNINGGMHGQMTGHMLETVENVLIKERPLAVLVYGDTNSTLAGALAASKLHIPVIHIEAGLRSYNKLMPEEINRVLTDHVSSILFCPTSTSVANLNKEGITQGVYHFGDVMYDATLYAIDKIKNNIQLKKKFDCISEDFAIMTIHRAESTNDREFFIKILNFASEFSLKHNLKIIFSVHPRTKKLVDEFSHCFPPNIVLINPLSYFEMHFILTKAKFVLTDSGGLQKEAYFQRVPCVTLRGETEWVETIQSGWNRLWTVDTYHRRREISDYGDGNASEKIVNCIIEKLSLI